MPYDRHDNNAIPATRPAVGEYAPILVPRPEFEQMVAAQIDPGSGIVGFQLSAQSPEQVMVYFEGNRVGASNLMRFEERVNQAYGRMVQRYPTVAVLALPLAYFSVAGQIEGYGNVTVTDPEAVARWTSSAPQSGERDDDAASDAPR